jgi:hypothetical protein
MLGVAVGNVNVKRADQASSTTTATLSCCPVADPDLAVAFETYSASSSSFESAGVDLVQGSKRKTVTNRSLVSANLQPGSG